MSLAHVPLPSIALVLTTDHVLIPRRPSVVQVGFDTAPVRLTRPPQATDCLMKTIDLRDVKPPSEEPFIHPVEADAAMELNNDGLEAAGGSREEGPFAAGIKKNVSHVLTAWRRLFPLKAAETFLRKISWH